MSAEIFKAEILSCFMNYPVSIFTAYRLAHMSLVRNYKLIRFLILAI